MVAIAGRQTQQKNSARRKYEQFILCSVILLAAVFFFSVRNSFHTLRHMKGINEETSTNDIVSSTLLIQPQTIETNEERDVEVTPKENTLKGDKANERNLNIPDVPTATAPLPDWITKYIEYHNQMRAKYPGKEIFTNPDAPPLLIRVCLGLCGGLHDRLGQLPLDLSMANETGRIFLLQWQKPHPLEEYLLPNEFDWTVPEGVGYDDMHAARAHTYLDLEPGTSLKDLDNVIEDMKNGDLSKIRILNTKLLGDQKGELLSSRLKKAHETDMIDDTLTFGRIFWSFFQINPKVQNLIMEQKEILQLHKNNYVAVHCRTRHPKGWSKDKPPPRAEVEGYPADKSDIIFEGYEKEFTVSVATHAIKCAQALQKNHPHAENIDHFAEPVYLLTDTFKVTNHMVSSPESPFSEDNQVIARDDSVPSFHIDRKKGRSIEEHYGTFLDLFFMIEARCITYGIGNFGRLASKISGTKCLNQHRQVQWDTHDAPRWFTTPCNIGDGLNEENVTE